MNPGGYGRTDDGIITCPRADSTTAPCAARDGAAAMTGDGKCEHCSEPVVLLHMTLDKQVRADEIAAVRIRTAAKFTALVRRVTEPPDEG